MNSELSALLDKAEAIIEQRFAALVPNEAAEKEARLRYIASAGIALKSIGQIVKRYGDQLENAIYGVWNGQSDPIDFRRIHKALLREMAPQVYEEGMREGGIDDPDEEDLADAQEKVDDWLGTQIPEVNDFAKAVGEAKKDKDLRDAILQRLELWVDSLRNLGDQGKGYANGNKRGQWILGETEKHCDSCLKLSRMKPHRVSWFLDRGYIPRQNGSESLDCKGFHCDCSIVDPKTGDQLL